MVKTSKKLLTMSLLIILIGITGCAQKDLQTDSAPGKLPQEQSQKASIAEDALGRQIEIPDSIDKVAVTCQGGTTHQIAVMGASDKILAQPSMTKFPMLLKIFPQFNTVIDAGSFDDVNIEEIMKADPDIVFVGITSKKGNKLIEDAGFNTFTMYIGSADVETQLKEFTMTGTILGNPEKAQQLIENYKSKIAMVQDMLSKVPKSERKTVYYVSGSITTASSGIWGDSLIKNAGGINVTSDYASGANGAEFSVEQVMQWNPDVIVTQKGKGNENLAAITDDKRISDLDAVRNKQVYQFPIGAFWWDRPSPEAPLGVMWLAKVVYPEYTENIDLKKETKDFYKTFYDYDLSDEDYNSFF